MYITLPGSKSITNRNLILASLSEGTTILRGILRSDDTKYMMQALGQLGFNIQDEGNVVTIYGGINHIAGRDQELFLGNSGTSTRFLVGLAILNRQGSITITGDERMRQRPIQDLIDGIAQLGIKIKGRKGFPPVFISGNNTITTKYVYMKGASSSQYFTALLQVAPLFPQGLHIEVEGELVSKPYIDMTIYEMKKFCVEVQNNDYRSFDIIPQTYKPQDLTVEGDASALSYFAAYFCLHGGELTITNIGSDSKQGDYRFLDVCSVFGLTYSSDGRQTTISAPGLPKGEYFDTSLSTIDMEDMPDVSMTLMILAIFIPETTVITGLQTLNLKECKRIDAMRDELCKLHIKSTSTQSTITLERYKQNRIPSTKSIDVETYHDHCIAMCFGILNSYIGGMNILNPECVNKTYPAFWNDLERISRKTKT